MTSIRNDNGTTHWFPSLEARDRTWDEMLANEERAKRMAQTPRRAALDAELAERAAMYGMTP